MMAFLNLSKARGGAGLQPGGSVVSRNAASRKDANGADRGSPHLDDDQIPK